MSQPNHACNRSRARESMQPAPRMPHQARENSSSGETGHQVSLEFWKPFEKFDKCYRTRRYSIKDSALIHLRYWRNFSSDLWLAFSSIFVISPTLGINLGLFRNNLSDFFRKHSVLNCNILITLTLNILVWNSVKIYHISVTLIDLLRSFIVYSAVLRN